LHAVAHAPKVVNAAGKVKTSTGCAADEGTGGSFSVCHVAGKKASIRAAFRGKKADASQRDCTTRSRPAALIAHERSACSIFWRGGWRGHNNVEAVLYRRYKPTLNQDAGSATGQP
jgi:hypothetical protein